MELSVLVLGFYYTPKLDANSMYSYISLLKFLHYNIVNNFICLTVILPFSCKLFRPITCFSDDFRVLFFMYQERNFFINIVTSLLPTQSSQTEKHVDN